MGQWGFHSDECDSVYDLVGDLLDAAWLKSHPGRKSGSAEPIDRRLLKAAASLLAEELPIGYQPIDVAGAIRMFWCHGVQVPRLAVRMAEVAVEMELNGGYRWRDNWGDNGPKRKAALRVELAEARGVLKADDEGSRWVGPPATWGRDRFASTPVSALGCKRSPRQTLDRALAARV